MSSISLEQANISLAGAPNEGRALGLKPISIAVLINDQAFRFLACAALLFPRPRTNYYLRAQRINEPFPFVASTEQGSSDFPSDVTRSLSAGHVPAD